MSINTVHDVEFGTELPAFSPDTSLARTAEFAQAVGWGNGRGRFDNHEAAKKQGLPGALVPGIMGMGFLTTTIHQWSAAAQIEQIDTVFRAPMLADAPLTIGAVVTDIDIKFVKAAPNFSKIRNHYSPAVRVYSNARAI